MAQPINRAKSWSSDAPLPARGRARQSRPKSRKRVKPRDRASISVQVSLSRGTDPRGSAAIPSISPAASACTRACAWRGSPKDDRPSPRRDPRRRRRRAEHRDGTSEDRANGSFPLKQSPACARGGLQDAAGLARRRRAYEGRQREPLISGSAWRLAGRRRMRMRLRPSGVGAKAHARMARCL